MLFINIKIRKIMMIMTYIKRKENYFHSIIKGRQARNSIHCLLNADEIRAEAPDDVKNLVVG